MESNRRVFLGAMAAAASASLAGRLSAQDLIYQCPMHPEVRSGKPGICDQCHMILELNIPEPTEFPMDLAISPKPIRAKQKTELTFTIRDPRTDGPVRNFQLVHEKLFHLFMVGADLKPEHFLHGHPVFGADGKFRYTYQFPQTGTYRLVGDFFPDGGTWQLSSKTVIVPGEQMETPHLTRNYEHREMTNMGISITTEPPMPIAGIETRIFVHLTNAEGLERYLGAWSHMLAASDDVIDLKHGHPFVADGGPEMRFDVYFPRARGYRVWLQFQKKNVVNTTYFDIPVSDIEAAADR